MYLDVTKSDNAALWGSILVYSTFIHSRGGDLGQAVGEEGGDYPNREVLDQPDKRNRH